jgi:hypothetical protein
MQRCRAERIVFPNFLTYKKKNCRAIVISTMARPPGLPVKRIAPPDPISASTGVPESYSSVDIMISTDNLNVNTE